MIQALKDGIVCVWSKAEIESSLGFSLSDKQFSKFIDELQNPDGTFEDMALATFDVVAEEVFSHEAFLDHAPKSFLPPTKHD